MNSATVWTVGLSDIAYVEGNNDKSKMCVIINHVIIWRII